MSHEQLVAALNLMLPIVEAAYWDHHTAGAMPGVGYNHRAEYLAGDTFGWRNSAKFKAWKKELEAAILKATQG